MNVIIFLKNYGAYMNMKSCQMNCLLEGRLVIILRLSVKSCRIRFKANRIQIQNRRRSNGPKFVWFFLFFCNWLQSSSWPDCWPMVDCISLSLSKLLDLSPLPIWRFWVMCHIASTRHDATYQVLTWNPWFLLLMHAKSFQRWKISNHCLPSMQHIEQGHY